MKLVNEISERTEKRRVQNEKADCTSADTAKQFSYRNMKQQYTQLGKIEKASKHEKQLQLNRHWRKCHYNRKMVRSK